MRAGDRRIVPGQEWERRSDGARTTVLEVEAEGLPRRTVTHKGKRVTHTEFDPFLTKYTLVREDPIVERLAAVLSRGRAVREGHSAKQPVGVDDLADAVALVETLGLRDVFTVAWDGEPSMSGHPHVKRTGTEFPTQERAQEALERVPSFRDHPDARVQQRIASPWNDLDGEA